MVLGRRRGAAGHAALSVGFALVVAGRAATACGSDEPASSAPPPDGQREDAASPPVEGGPRPEDAASPNTPAYCRGIVFYASFDQGASADVGGGPALSDGGVVLRPGRFGKAVSLVNDAGAATALFYDRLPADAGDAAAAPIVYPEREGTLAYWYNQAAPLPSVSSHVRPLQRDSAGASPGLVVAVESSRFGLWRGLGLNDDVLTVGLPALAPFVRRDDFDHFAVAWRKPDADAGVAAIVRLAINGGVGKVLSDAGLDAASLDGSADDAGNFVLPYRAQSNVPFTTTGRLDALRIGGLPNTAAQGNFDDFVIWDRVLSFDEITQVYESGTSIGTRCSL